MAGPSRPVRTAGAARRHLRVVPDGEPAVAGPAPGLTAEAPSAQDAERLVIRALAARARSRHELAELLRRREVPGDVAEATLDRLTEAGVVDDGAFAREFVDLHRTRQGSRAILAELRAKGIDTATAQAALEDSGAADVEWETAAAFAARRVPSMARLEPEVARRRLTGALVRRGFRGDVVSGVVREALAGHG